VSGVLGKGQGFLGEPSGEVVWTEGRENRLSSWPWSPGSREKERELGSTTRADKRGVGMQEVLELILLVSSLSDLFI
jgi:hypothetical protein